MIGLNDKAKEVLAAVRKALRTNASGGSDMSLADHEAATVRAEQIIATALAEETLDAVEGERMAAKAKLGCAHCGESAATLASLGHKIGCPARSPARRESLAVEAGNDFNAAARMIERWRKRNEEQRGRIAWLEGAILGKFSAEDAEKVIGSGPGRRETEPAVRLAPRFVCGYDNGFDGKCDKPAPKFYYREPCNPLCDEHAAKYLLTRDIRADLYERCERCWRDLAPEHAVKYDGELCWTRVQAIPPGYGALNLADFHTAMVGECTLATVKRKG